MGNPYDKGDDVVTLLIEDCTGRRISKQRASASDDKAILNLFKSMIDKYGLNIRVVMVKKNNIDWIKADENFKW